MSSPSIDELLPPASESPRPFPWRTVLALFLPAAALAAGTGLQRLLARPGDAVVQWLLWSTAAGLLVGVGVALVRRGLLWAVYGAAAPWLVVGLFAGVMSSARPLREAVADRREAACRAEGRAVCTLPAFTSRCAQAQGEPEQAKALLGEPRTAACTGQACTYQWVYAGPFRPGQVYTPAIACFVQTDAQGHGTRHWTMGTE